MKTDTYLNAAKANMYFILSGTLALASFILLGIAGEFTRHPFTIAIPVVMVIVYLFLHLLKLNFIIYNDEGNHYIFRFYNVHPFLRRKKAFQIPKSQLEKYIIKESYGGFRKELILFQKHKKQIIEYPALGISLLTDKQIKQIERSLQKNARKETLPK